MNKSAIKNYAIYARNKLRQSTIDMAASIGVHKDKIETPISQGVDYAIFKNALGIEITLNKKEIEQRASLIKKINNSGFEQVIEEISYTWFNRLIAIRFMEVNDYLPSRIRVLSSEIADKKETDLMISPFNCDLDFNEEEKNYIINLKDTNKQNELFKFLFIKQCNKLNEILPALFETTEDYSELLFNINYLDEEDVVYKLVNEIPESNFNVEEEGQVEIIGWMYQYYNEERKNEVINIFKGTVKKEDIPAATQLFTPDWVVRYIVDNSLGRYWIERNPDSNLLNYLKFFVTSKENTIDYIERKIDPKELTFIDPCMGSGHILVYAFDVFMEIYKECGYTERDATEYILENNLFGLDIDDRAYQLSYFAVLMKARSYNRRILNKNIKTNVFSIKETNSIDSFYCEGLTNNVDMDSIGEYLLTAFKDAKEIGSILNVKKYDYEKFIEYLNSIDMHGQISIEVNDWFHYMKPLMLSIAKQALIMTSKYHVVCTNPPYLGKMQGALKQYVVENYKDYSGDLFSVFIYKNFDYLQKSGYSGFMTPFVWMFIKTYEKLRNYIIQNKSITTLIQMEYSAFEEATVPICSFVLKNKSENKEGYYFRLSDFKGGMDIQKQKVLEALNNKSCGYFYETLASNFDKIPGHTISYWVNKSIISLYLKGDMLEVLAYPKTGMTTGNNNRFLRLWQEISINKCYLNASSSHDALRSHAKWFPYCKGGGFRRWYGHNEYLVNWENDGFEIKNNIKDNGIKAASIRSETLYFKSLITWSAVTSGKFSCRSVQKGFLFDSGGSSISVDFNKLFLLAFLNGKVSQFFLNICNSTINYQPGDIAKLPIIINDVNQVEEIVVKNMIFAKTDWDSFETSWDFLRHPLIKSMIKLSMDNTLSEKYIESSYMKWESECTDRFNQLKQNEEELNRIFIDIYGLQDELTPEVADKDVTVRKADLKRDIKSFISYAFGCMFGRYSLDNEGLIYAGGEWDMSKYSSFIPDQDNIIPITDEEYFNDDIVGRFIEFVKVVYGAETLEDNLEFIAKALSNKGNTSREIIRSYFLNDFFKDHCQTYQVTGSGKRPIYWQFDSGKQNGFKAIMYMHRYNEDTVGKVRTEYLHKIQSAYEEGIKSDDYTIENSNSSVEIAKARKHKEKLIKQLEETKNYDQALAHKAAERIRIDLDDGVKHNYELFQGVEVVNEGSKMIKIDLLAPIK